MADLKSVLHNKPKVNEELFNKILVSIATTTRKFTLICEDNYVTWYNFYAYAHKTPENEAMFRTAQAARAFVLCDEVDDLTQDRTYDFGTAAMGGQSVAVARHNLIVKHKHLVMTRLGRKYFGVDTGDKIKEMSDDTKNCLDKLDVLIEQYKTPPAAAKTEKTDK